MDATASVHTLYAGLTGPCGSVKTIFGYQISSSYTSLNIKFGVNGTFHLPKTSVHRFDLYSSSESANVVCGVS